MSNLYELIDERRGDGLKRLRAVAVPGIEPGTLGGLIAGTHNLAASRGAWVSGNARVFGDARVFGNARVFGDARVSGIMPQAARSDGYTFALFWTTEGLRITAGCRYFTFDEARQHWQETRAGTQLGEETFAILDYFATVAPLVEREALANKEATQ